MSAVATKTKKTKGKTADQIYQEVTDRIVEALEAGTVPWQRPWRVRGGVHMNLKSKRSYRGINQFLLDFTAQTAGYRQPYWMTYKQAKELGGQVRGGEKSTMVVFWKPIIVEKKDANGKKVVKDGKKVMTKIFLFRYYNVFNAEQIDGIEDKIPVVEEEEVEDFNPIKAAQVIIDEMPSAPPIKHGGDRACYIPMLDSINLPEPEQFLSPEDYYHTAYHELVHSTGHEDRLGRIKDWTTFGSDPYAKEELVAEMGAAMLAGIVGIDIPTKDNTASYISSWLSRIKGDKKLVVQAAGKAQQAADFIIGAHEENDDTTEH